MTPQKGQRWGLLAGSSLGWGLSWPAMKVLLTQLPPMFARGTAGMAAVLVLAAIAVARGEPLAELAPLPNLAWQLGLGCFPMLLFGIVWARALVMTLSGIALVLRRA